MPFVLLPDHHPGNTLDATRLAAQLKPAPVQRSLFDALDDAPLLAQRPALQVFTPRVVRPPSRPLATELLAA